MKISGPEPRRSPELVEKAGTRGGACRVTIVGSELEESHIALRAEQRERTSAHSGAARAEFIPKEGGVGGVAG